MQWNVSRYEVVWPEDGPATVQLFAGAKQVASVQFSDAPLRRFDVNAETRVVGLQLAASERQQFMDLLRNERNLVIDTEAPRMIFRR